MVLAVLREYSRAYERMDVRATKAVYPSVDDRRLRRAFDDLREQQVRFASCGVTISSSGAGANAWCKGDASFRPKVGSPRYYPNREWTFSLGRDAGRMADPEGQHAVRRQARPPAALRDRLANHLSQSVRTKLTMIVGAGLSPRPAETRDYLRRYLLQGGVTLFERA